MLGLIRLSKVPEDLSSAALLCSSVTLTWKDKAEMGLTLLMMTRSAGPSLALLANFPLRSLGGHPLLLKLWAGCCLVLMFVGPWWRGTITSLNLSQVDVMLVCWSQSRVRLQPVSTNGMGNTEENCYTMDENYSVFSLKETAYCYAAAGSSTSRVYKPASWLESPFFFSCCYLLLWLTVW